MIWEFQMRSAPKYLVLAALVISTLSLPTIGKAEQTPAQATADADAKAERMQQSLADMNRELLAVLTGENEEPQRVLAAVDAVIDRYAPDIEAYAQAVEAAAIADAAEITLPEAKAARLASGLETARAIRVIVPQMRTVAQDMAAARARVQTSVVLQQPTS